MYDHASKEPLDIIEANECFAPYSLATARFQTCFNEIERLRAVLASLTKDPPATLSHEPDEDWEVIVKMRVIAREALVAANQRTGDASK